MGLFSKIGGAIKGAVKGTVGSLGKGVKGLGRLAQGDIKGALGGFAGALPGLLTVAGIPGLSIPGLSNLGGLFGGAAGAAGEGGGGGIRGFLGGLLSDIGGGSKGKGVLNLGLLGADLLSSSKQRKSSEAFEQQRLDALTNFIAQGEAEFARKAPLRTGGQDAILQAIGNLGSSPVASFFRESREGTRAAGEFTKRKKKDTTTSHLDKGVAA